MTKKSIRCEHYLAPACRAYAARTRGVICGSYGESGRAGDGYDSGNTTDIDGDF